MNRNIIVIIFVITIISFIGILVYKYINQPTNEEQIIYKVLDRITINGVSIKELQYHVITFEGGSNPYLWDLWKPKGLIRYFFIEDLSPERTDNYRDTIIGISLLYPVEEKNRDYPNNKILNQDVVLNACIYVTVEGSSSKLVKYEEHTIVNYTYCGTGVGFMYGLRYEPIPLSWIDPT
jgi:hypothetical protein